MKKSIIKTASIGALLTLILATNCFATNEYNYKENNNEYIRQTYIVTQDNENDFLLNLEKELKRDKKNFKLDNTSKTGGDEIETIDINTSKTIKSNSNKLEDILEQLPEKIEYNENDFIGEYKLDINSIKTESQYNGYKEYLVEETKVYNDLDNNDLNNIPKQVMKNGMVLDLITTNWEVTETRNIQDNTIPSKYKANCYYAAKKKVDNPLTYIVTANYIGTATKTIKNNYRYVITYKLDSIDKNYVPVAIISSGTLFIICLIGFRKKNITIYNFQNKEWRKIGKQRITKPIIKLDRYNYKVNSNRYLIEIDEKFIEKNNGKMLKIKRQNRTKEMLINKNNNTKPYTLDIVI